MKYAKILAQREAALIAVAIEARSAAFSPFSGSQVGCAVLVYDGTIFSGANVEFTRSSNIHAEFIAMQKALAYVQEKLALERDNLLEKIKNGLEEIVAIAEATNSAIPGCGNCRQMLLEINPEIVFYGILPSGKIANKQKISNLYPNPYRSNNRAAL